MDNHKDPEIADERFSFKIKWIVSSYTAFPYLDGLFRGENNASAFTKKRAAQKAMRKVREAECEPITATELFGGKK